ncbi:hypothetical protein EDD86DRAFT_247487 [Gorgonomyces haynaldii]|nr:hypothetical protein EDD86DRAFT_247487 [Gorgonomyces haynaldii]
MGIKLVRQGTPTPADHKFTPDAKLSPLAAKLAKRDSISSLQSTPSQKARSSELSRMFGSEESTRASLVKTDSVQSLFSQKGITSASKSLPVAISKSETPKTQQPVIQEKTASAGKLPVSVAKKTHPASASATPSASKTSTPTVVKPVAQKPTLPAAKVSELKPLTPKVSDSASKPATSKAPAPKPAEKAPDSSAQWPDENDDVRINKTGTKRILAEDSDDGATFSDVIYVQSDSDLDQPKKRKRLSNAAKDKTADYPWYCQLCLDMFEDKKAVRKHLQQYHRITNDESAVMEPLMARHVDSETFVDMDVDNLDKEPGETSKNALLFVDVMMGKSGKDAKKCVLCGDELTLDSTECPLCGTFFDNFLGLRKEQTVVNEPQCPRCKQLFTDFLALKEHCAKNCAVTIQEEPKRSELPSDSEDEVLLQSPSKFMLTKTNTLHKLICPKCNQPFDNELQLNAHGCTETGIAHFSLDDDDDDKILGLSAPI